VEEGSDLRNWAESEIGIDRAAWYTALASVIGNSVAAQGAPTRWTWPGRRDARDMGGAMVPRWTGERPRVAVVIDTSGSITQYDLDMARAAGHYIGQVADPTYYGCSTRATLYGPTMPEHIKGGGGTSMPNGIRTAIADGAHAVIVITDCQTDWDITDVGVPVIIGANLGARAIIAAGPDGGGWLSQWYPPQWMTVLPVTAD
jgi:predicted metal-dependent peptidase